MLLPRAQHGVRNARRHAHDCAQAIPYQDRIPAVGLSSTELGNPNIEYKDVYAAATEAGFIPVAHAGARSLYGPCTCIHAWRIVKANLALRRCAARYSEPSECSYPTSVCSALHVHI